MDNVREIVLDALLETERGTAFSNRIMVAVLTKYNYLEHRDKAFLKRLYEGTTELRIRLDYVLDLYSSTKTAKMKPLIRCLLRMSVYQILYMEQVPDGAAVSEAVKLCKKRGFGTLSGFVNGVLRSVAREKDHLKMPDADRDPVFFLSVECSVPAWLAEHFLALYGRERAEKILRALLEVHPVSLRFAGGLDEAERERVMSAICDEGVILEPSPLSENIRLATHLEGVAGLPGYAEGAFLVQDASSALAVRAVGIRPGDFVVDACAAPGGKSLLAAELTGPSGKVLARDLGPEKVDRIRENAARMRAENVEAEVWDATQTDEALAGKADVLLLDVPCSGLGILGKKRDIKYRITPEEIDSLQALQRRIVEASWQMVRPGGRMLYSTCTISPKENEEQADWIEAHLPFVRTGESRQFLPGEDPCDGFYYQVFTRKA
ncbi:MAG: 16S rRNA (cytosine(967)-C(5))-methyltransferase RsmB [Lachnospiraceae bacterium]|nr:16S rRNA (cytosine(967)-C(5))-methyltransferase RsmB [Lachnospiraceae bacterium]